MFKQTSIRPKRGPTLLTKSHSKLVRELPANPSDTMEDFLRESRKGLWHAFHLLDSDNDDSVPTSQLKVITSNIGLKLGFDKAEQFLDKDGLKSTDFITYLDIVKSEMFDKLTSDSENGQGSYGALLNDVLSVCWTFCSFKGDHETKSLSQEHGLMLWRLFNFLCEVTDSDEPIYPIILHKEEAGFILKEFIETTGQRSSEQAVRNVAEGDTEFYTFAEFLNLFEKGFIQSLTESDITLGLNQLYEMVIMDVLKKGMMWKRGHNVKNWKERWLILTPKSLKYYVNQTERQLKGTVEFDTDCKIEITSDKPGHKPNRFVLHTKKKPYDMSAHDLKTKNEWVSAFQLAISHAGKDVHVQREEAKKRRNARAEAKRLAAEEKRRRQEDAELLRKRQDELDEERKKRLEDEALLLTRLGELEEERKRRADAEARFQEEQALREEEQRRLRELEAIKLELEKLLDAERQAKKDEEIVRALQGKLLEEEFQRREELERLKQEQEEMLLAEREQKAVLESDRQEQERRLKEAQERLEQLERERLAADEKLQEASDKLSQAEKQRQIMEEKANLWKKPVGLARQILPTANPHVTHRGEGAFCESDFQKTSSGPTRDTEDLFLRKLQERALRSESPQTDGDKNTGKGENLKQNSPTEQRKKTDDNTEPDDLGKDSSKTDDVTADVPPGGTVENTNDCKTDSETTETNNNDLISKVQGEEDGAGQEPRMKPKTNEDPHIYHKQEQTEEKTTEQEQEVQTKAEEIESQTGTDTDSAPKPRSPTSQHMYENVNIDHQKPEVQSETSDETQSTEKLAQEKQLQQEMKAGMNGDIVNSESIPRDCGT